MAAFLIDYENVRGDGLKGTDVLKNSDMVIIFYSNCCNKVRADSMREITNSGCEFKAVKLKQTGKNGLDFYIAVECGIISENNESEIAIISNDKGFQAVIDFFKVNGDSKDIKLVKAPNIEVAITKFNSKEDINRRNVLQHRMESLDIAAEYERIKAHKEYIKKIELILQETEYTDRIQDIVQFVELKRNCNKGKVYVYK